METHGKGARSLTDTLLELLQQVPADFIIDAMCPANEKDERLVLKFFRLRDPAGSGKR